MNIYDVCVYFMCAVVHSN